MILFLVGRLGCSARGFVATRWSFTRRTAREARMMEGRPDNLSRFDIIDILRAHGTDMTCLPTMVALGCLHPFQERKGIFAGVDNIHVIFIAGECLVSIR